VLSSSAGAPYDTVIDGGFAEEALPVGGKDEPLPDTGFEGETVAFENGETGDAVLKGFTITGGWIGVLCSDASPKLIGNIIAGNAWNGVYVTGAQATPAIVNNIVGHNAGAGLYVRSSAAPRIVNNTIVANQDQGVYTISAAPAITNCAFWGNGTDLVNCTASYSCYNPTFVDADGQDDQSWTWEDNNYHLAAGSAGIDAGDNDAPELAGITTDLGGNPRFVDDPSTPDSGNGAPPIVDAGAYEDSFKAPADFDRDGDVDGDDLLAFKVCVSGSAVPFNIGCDEKDFDDDGDVDQSDFGTFQRCLSGEGNPAEPNCAN
jgi:parallel beta-helix repeat protein